MKANELRIGNMVMYGKTPVQCGLADLSVLSSGLPKGHGFNYYDSIKLTEESILKLDFEKDNSENNKTYLSPMVNGSRMKIYFNRFGVAKFTMNMFHQTEIENVHTLQNLFFALYGSELVFSTEP